MAYALRFDGVNDRVTIASAMTGGAGTSAYSFRVKSSPAGITLPAAYGGFVCAGGVSVVSGFVVTSGGLLEVWRNGVRLYGSASQLIFNSTEFDYTLDHTAGGSWTITNNLTSTVVDSGTFTTNVSWSSTNALNQFGRAGNTGTNFLAGNIALIAVTGLINADTWDADLSGGSGSVWPSVSGTNNGTLVNFPTDNSQWIFYSSGGYTLTADGATFSYSGAAASTLLNRQLPSDGATYSYSGGAAATLYNRKLSADGGTYIYSGAAATLTYTAAGIVYTLNADGAVFGYTGAAAQLLANRALTADGGSFTYSGGNAEFDFNGYPQADANAFVVSYRIAGDTVLTASISDSARFSAIISQSTTVRYMVN